MTTPDSWIFAIEEDKLREGAMNLVSPRGISILLIKRDKEIYAISNKCAHMACPLAAGMLEGYLLQCPCHDWRFDIRTGEFIEAKEIKLPTYRVKITDNNIYIQIGG